MSQFTSAFNASIFPTIPTQFPTDAGIAIPAANILNVFGGASTGNAVINMNTRGTGNTVEVNLNNSIFQPNTNATQTEGMYGLGGATFLHNYGTENTFCGANAGNLTLTALDNGNTGIGFEALNSLTNSPGLNTAVGRYALTNVTSGTINCAVGADSGMSLTIGDKNCLLGQSTLKNAIDATDNIAIGNAAMLTVSALCQFNIAMGTNSMSSFNNTSSGNIMIGFGSAANVDFAGNYNVGIGYGVAATIIGDDNIAIGRLSMVSSAVAATSTNNIALGYQTMGYLGTGLDADYSIGIGYRSMYVASTADYNSALGYQTLLALTTGDYNTALGYNAGNAITTGSSNISISNVGAVESNTIRIGTQGNGAGQQDRNFQAGIYGVTVASSQFVTVDANGQLGSVASATPAWVDVTGTTQTIAVNTNYLSNNAATVTFTLPATAALGDVFRIAGANSTVASRWTIAQNANQAIVMGSITSTVGVGGSVASTSAADAIELVCTTAGASTRWTVISSMGTLAIV